VSFIWRRAAPRVLGLGLAGLAAATAGAIPAQAGQAGGPAADSVTLSATSPVRDVTGDTLVAYGVRGKDSATVSGTVSGVAAGDVAVLLSEPFGADGFSPTGQSVTITSSSQHYAFTVSPFQATEYQVEVETPSVALPAIAASSPVRTVYVELVQRITSIHHTCAHDECTETIVADTRVPAAAYQVEAAKRWYLYLGVRRSRGKVHGVAPKYLTRSPGSTASGARQVSATEFQTVFSFRVVLHHENAEWWPNACTKDAEAADGIGLPGRHGCGARKVRYGASYLG
jgi:hypothetical protein